MGHSSGLRQGASASERQTSGSASARRPRSTLGRESRILVGWAPIMLHSNMESGQSPHTRARHGAVGAQRSRSWARNVCRNTGSKATHAGHSQPSRAPRFRTRTVGRSPQRGRAMPAENPPSLAIGPSRRPHVHRRGGSRFFNRIKHLPRARRLGIAIAMRRLQYEVRDSPNEGVCARTQEALVDAGRDRNRGPPPEPSSCRRFGRRRVALVARASARRRDGGTSRASTRPPRGAAADAPIELDGWNVLVFAGAAGQAVIEHQRLPRRLENP